MADETQTNSFLLSREELILLLDLLEIESIPGLDPDPLGELSDDQRALALIWAGRALQARELATVADDGSLLVNEQLLTAVGTCAYWETAVTVFHWSAPGSTPQRLFGYVGNGKVTTHARPAGVLHRVSTLPTAADLINELMTFNQCQSLPETPNAQFELAQDVFVQARELAESQDVEASEKVLSEGGLPEDNAKMITAVLSGKPRMSIWQIVQQAENGESTAHEYTLLQNDQAAWLIQLNTGEEAVHLQTITTTAIKELLTQYVSIS